MTSSRVLCFFATILLLVSCEEPTSPPLFERISSDHSGITFANDLDYLQDFNIYTYRNFYNGGGVAVGDLDLDGLVDLYFTGNMRSNRLYLNKGDLDFKDITESSGTGGAQSWSTGVTMADVNGDGLLDIYVCNSGDIAGDRKQNELFINQGKQNGNVVFEEQAESFGLADQGYGTHAAFFDYDRDNDLDCYLLNNSYRSIFDFNLRKNQREIRDTLGGDKLFRNNGDGTFSDVSVEADIYGSEIGFGLGVTVGDVNRDGWLDMYISNDFFERDYLYINNQDGTFSELLEEQMRSLSVASMGADMADINNDGFPEIFVTEMLPEHEDRLKTKMTFESWDRYQYNLQNGYYHQFTRNVLQLNNGNGTFSEIGRLANIEATDWSWGALIADYDNDGQKDLFVSNGLNKDIIDQDYINFVSNEEIIRQMVTSDGVNYRKLIDTIPSTPISNYMFHQTGPLEFTNVAQQWGLDAPSHSNGSVYADFDNDGDLDLAVNNVNSEAFLYRNQSQTLLPENNFLKILLQGHGTNPYAVGANVTLFSGAERFYLESVPSRGFQSAVDPRLNFGLGEIGMLDSIVVVWPKGSTTRLLNIPVNQILEITEKDTQKTASNTPGPGTPIFTNITSEQSWGFVHEENEFVDFDRDRLIYHMVSTDGPKIDQGDFNGDGLMDFFICGAANQASALFLQQSAGSFTRSQEELFRREASAEDLGCEFFDADGDGDLDLYAARGGNEFLMSQNTLVDQLYVNDAQTFRRSPQYLPTFKPESSGVAESADYDGDGDMDLFVGIRIVPGYYGLPANGYLLANDGSGKFSNVTEELAPELNQLGLITDAIWIDYDQDQDQDLIVVGEWMPISFFENKKGKLVRTKTLPDDQGAKGWWNCIEQADLDGDGDPDLIVGNHGLNSRFKASQKKPLSIYVNDFDQNGTPEPIINQYNGDRSYPMVLRHDLVMQIPSLKKQFQLYHQYEGKVMADIFDEKSLRTSSFHEVDQLESLVLWNNGNGKFESKPLPLEAQFSPIYAITTDDFDGDGQIDILVGGNLYGVKPEVGRYDASYGLLLRGVGQGIFQPISAQQSGFLEIGQIRDFALMQIANKNHLLVAKNNAQMQIYTY